MSKLTVAVAATARPVSVRTISASMIAVAVALGAALVVPAVSGMPTGSQATVAVNQQADWGQHSPRQRRIMIARDNRESDEAIMVTAQSASTPAM